MNGKNDCDIEENHRSVSYNLIFYYQGFYVEPQNNKIPVEKFDKTVLILFI